MGSSSRQLMFLAVSVAEGKEHPRSVNVADALMRETHNSIVLPTLEEARIVANGSWVIPLVDDDYDVNRWSPRQITNLWTPAWVRQYATSGWWIAVGKPCVSLPHEAMGKLADQMARRFSLNNNDPRGEEKWGPRPAEKTYSVTGRHLPSHGWSQGRIG